ncbi:MAG TPA: cobaltochelatase subunit CobN [Candidatus Avacidaminococcus intestinavium]|uniref:Cobaltochelatase subunit CobN n=1 Tax=Candidatus Avacidaminococcus intestinavium TaxID=2840684 RepID=A0A9D1SLA7_9FIRM|nr:cobaltochelatase subunit CobN [Candidatus Avacidaminococcus intestinavium]
MHGILLMTNVEKQYQHLEAARIFLEEKSLLPKGTEIVYFNRESKMTQRLESLIVQSSVVLICWQGPLAQTEISSSTLKIAQRQKITCALLSSTEDESQANYNFNEQDAAIIRKYYAASGAENYQQLLLYVANRFAGNSVSYQPPKTLPWMGNYIKQERTEGKPVIGILFARENWIWQETAYIDLLIKEIENNGMVALPVFCLWSANLKEQIPGFSEAVTQYFYQDNQCLVNVVINTFKVGLTQSKSNDKHTFKNLNVPVLQGYNLLRSLSEWEETFTGMNPIELSCNVVQPEFDGVIHGLPLSSKENTANQGMQYIGIDERVQAFVRKIKKWAVLSMKKNEEKRIAIIFHNYPPTNDSIGSAQGLDSTESVVDLLKYMVQCGYKLDELPTNGKSLIQELTQGITNDRRFLSEQKLSEDSNKITTKEYDAYFRTLPRAVQVSLEEEWGKAPGDVFKYDDSLVLPGKENGNFYITMQPPRGFGEDPGKIIHSPTCPPPHHYLAFYHWLRNIWRADAVIHVGTHGSLEWLPGKNAGLSAECYPDVALGDLPNIYPYLVTIVGEGLQAKRRSSACLIGHLNPPVDRADTYDDLAELEKLLDEYAKFNSESPGNAVVAKQIQEKIRVMHLEEDLPQEDATEDEYILKIHTYIERLKHMQIRTGLHILGKIPLAEELKNYVLALTRVENNEIPSLPQTIAGAWGFDYYELETKSGQVFNGKSGAELLGELWTLAESIVEYLILHQENERVCTNLCAEPFVKNSLQSAAFKTQLMQVAQYIVRTIIPNLLKTKQEILNTIKALEGAFIEAGPGGAPTSGRADILPTGRNFYGVDPNNLPTPAAWEVGKVLAEQAIERYLKEEGRYPESIGIVMWSDSNIRSNGQCIAEFLYLLGVKPIWQRGSMKVTGLEVLPLSELQRPRIDVMARISGLFRDSMAVAVNLLENAINLVKNLQEDETQNYIVKHYNEELKNLLQDGYENQEAETLAACRIFGCPSGGYGAGVASLLEEKNWENIDDLADVYVRWGGHIYGKELAGEYKPELFRRRLGTLDITIKNIDNHEVHLLNSDDFNAYCGGMNAAVKSIRGVMPRCYIGDSSDRSKAETKSLDQEFRRVFRGESLNPKYLEGMKKHGYKGASDLAGLVAHAYGWDATSKVMNDWMYESLAEKLALDKDMQAWMKEVNPWALERIVSKLLEAEQRHLWQAQETTKAALAKVYLEIEGQLEEQSER